MCDYVDTLSPEEQEPDVAMIALSYMLASTIATACRLETHKKAVFRISALIAEQTMEFADMVQKKKSTA